MALPGISDIKFLADLEYLFDGSADQIPTMTNFLRMSVR